MNPLLTLLLLVPQTADEPHRAAFEKAADSVVGVRAMAPLGERSGSGVVLSKDGYIATSYSICPEGASNIRVFFRGPRMLTGRIVATSKAYELVLIKVEPKRDLVPIEFGDSAAVKQGDVSYTLGNASNSIINNDSASLAVGIISGLYTLDIPRANSTYVGPVFETTAAVNVGMEGSPLLDAKGRMVGFVTLNYSPSRFLGNAIPATPLRAVIDKLRAASAGDGPVAGSENLGPGYLGLNVVDRDGRVVVESVDPGSPADLAGLVKGTVIVAFGGRELKDAAEFLALQKDMKEGDLLFLKINDSGSIGSIKITLAKKGAR